jgi:GNAT superfamily N-acetyltransferase
VPGVYGVPEQWPHVSALYEQAGFVHNGHTEVVYLAKVSDLPRLASPPFAGLDVRRTVGLNGTRLSAVLGGEVIGYIELEIRAEGERIARQAAWADVGNLRVSERYWRRKVATWLLGQAADWLELAHVDRRDHGVPHAPPRPLWPQRPAPKPGSYGGGCAFGHHPGHQASTFSPARQSA